MASAAMIFDLDGTLWDSWGFYAEIISMAGGDRNRAINSLKEGVPIARLLREAGISGSSFRAMARQARGQLHLYAGVRDVLLVKKDSGVRMGIVTSLPRWIAAPMLEVTDLSPFFDTVVDWGRCRVPKPSADPILLALEDLGLSSDRTIWYVGDTIVDSRAARAAGLSFAWASYGYGAKVLVEADKILGSFAEVLEL